MLGSGLLSSLKGFLGSSRLYLQVASAASAPPLCSGFVTPRRPVRASHQEEGGLWGGGGGFDH